MKASLLLPGRPLAFLLGAIIFVLTCSGCGQKVETPDPVISWPELLHFEALLREAESLVATSQFQKTLEKRVALLNAGWAVAPATTPENVADMEKVRALLGDLVSKLNGLAVSSLSPEKLRELIEGIRPILNDLFEASGVEGP